MKFNPILAATLVTLSSALPVLANGSKLAFWSRNSGNNEIYVVNPNGTGLTNITNTPGVDERFPAWDPTATKIAYQRPDAVWLMNADGSGQAPFVTGNDPTEPAYRPNAGVISYTRWTGPDTGQDIVTRRTDGRTELKIVRNNGAEAGSTWNVDGSKVAFHNNEGYIFTANPDGSGQTQLTFTRQDWSPSWSPDGGRIVFHSYRHGPAQLYVMNADGTGQTRLTTNTRYNDTSPVFSPDGTKIAFVSDRTGNKEIFVMNANGTGFTQITNNTAVDDDPAWGLKLPANAPKISISDAPTHLTESSEGPVQANFTISLAAKATIPVTVTYRTYDGTATANSDYTPSSGTLTFAPGETTKTISVPVLDDTTDEDLETFYVRISTIQAAIIKQSGVGTIIGSDQPPTLSIADAAFVEGNSGNDNAIFPISLSEPSGFPVTVQYTITDGTAIGGNDYRIQTGTITIPAGQTTTPLALFIYGETVREADETFTITLTNPVKATLERDQATGTILNDDVTPYLYLGSGAALEGNAVSFGLELSYPADVPITITYSTENNSAIAPGDFEAANSSTLTIPAGETVANIVVNTVADSGPEDHERFVLRLNQVNNALPTETTGWGTITNNDFPNVFVSDVQMREGKSGERAMFFTVAFATPLASNVQLTYQTQDLSAQAGTDYVPVSGTLHFPAYQISQYVAVPILGDKTFEPNEVFYFKLTDASGATILTPQARGTILNDDAQPSLSIRDAAITEGQSGTKNLTFEVRLSNPSTKNVTVGYTTADGTAVAGMDYTAKSGRLTIPPGQTSALIQIPIVGDTIPEADEVFKMLLNTPLNAPISQGEATGTITNDDSAATLSTRSN